MSILLRSDPGLFKLNLNYLHEESYKYFVHIFVQVFKLL